VALVLAVPIIYLAIPRAVSAIVAVPGDHVLRRVQNGEAVSDKNLDTLIESRERALAWFDSGRLHTDLALAVLLKAERLGPESEELEKTFADRAIDLIHLGLSRAPARPYAWTRLAHAEMLANGVSPASARALEMSFRTGAHNPHLAKIRLKLALYNWSEISPEVRKRVLQQIRVVAKGGGPPDDVIDAAGQVGRLDVLRIALFGDPKALKRLERRASKRGW
jgi:hypothetical protein